MQRRLYNFGSVLKGPILTGSDRLEDWRCCFHEPAYLVRAVRWRTQLLDVLSPRPARGEGIGGEGR